MLTADGSFVFAAQDDGSDYTITVLTQPIDPLQLCAVSNAEEEIDGADVIAIVVSCVVRPDAISSDRNHNGRRQRRPMDAKRVA